MSKNINHKYHQIISIENLLKAWQEFIKNKRNRLDVRYFEQNLMKNILELHCDLSNFSYQHSSYIRFKVSDPKPRIIHKACVRDRLLHHAVYRKLYPIFDETFIFDAYSCRKGKGTHKAFRRLVCFARKQSKNYSGNCWALKIDIRKFFHSVDHDVLVESLKKRMEDNRLLAVLKEIIQSFASSPYKVMPLGNLTSQLFANIYLDSLDKFIKHKLKIRYYLRYADDLLLLSGNCEKLKAELKLISDFFTEKLQLKIHSEKIFFRKLKWGIDFVGYEAHKKFNLPRRKTVIRIFKNINSANLSSCLGYLKHVNSYKLSSTLGMAYKDNGGGNDSAIHWDIVKNMKKGKIILDGKVVQENGRWKF